MSACLRDSDWGIIYFIQELFWVQSSNWERQEESASHLEKKDPATSRAFFVKSES